MLKVKVIRNFTDYNSTCSREQFTTALADCKLPRVKDGFKIRDFSYSDLTDESTSVLYKLPENTKICVQTYLSATADSNSVETFVVGLLAAGVGYKNIISAGLANDRSHVESCIDKYDNSSIRSSTLLAIYRKAPKVLQGRIKHFSQRQIREIYAVYRGPLVMLYKIDVSSTTLDNHELSPSETFVMNCAHDIFKKLRDAHYLSSQSITVNYTTKQLIPTVFGYTMNPLSEKSAWLLNFIVDLKPDPSGFISIPNDVIDVFKLMKSNSIRDMYAALPKYPEYNRCVNSILHYKSDTPVNQQSSYIEAFKTTMNQLLTDTPIRINMIDDTKAILTHDNGHTSVVSRFSHLSSIEHQIEKLKLTSDSKSSSSSSESSIN